MSDGVYIPNELVPLLRDCLRDYQSGRLGGSPGGDEETDVRQTPKLVCLLEDLNSNEPAKAVVLVRDREIPITHDVCILGDFDEAGDDDKTFTVSIGGFTSEPIAWNATAKEFGDAVFASGLLTGGDVNSFVSLGKLEQDGEEWPTGRFLLSTDADVTLTVADANLANLGGGTDVVVKTSLVRATTNIVEVITGIPTGDPTPLRTGSFCWVLPVEGFGLVAIAAEPRKFSITREDDDE